MIRLLTIGIAVLSSIPVILLILVWQYALYRHCYIKKSIQLTILALYLAAVFSATGISSIYALEVHFDFNLIPLLDILNSPVEYVKNTLLNIILFIPLGFLLPFFWKEYRSLKTIALTGFFVSFLIEILQIFTYRLTDIDDLMTNLCGTMIGYYIARFFLDKPPIKATDHTNIPAKNEPVFIFLITLLYCLFVQNLLSGKIWDMILMSPLWEKIR